MSTAIGAPLVSVVLPTFNRRKLLGRAIGSVLGQSFADLELIVVDDCSTEDIRSLVDSYQDPRLIYLRRERNGGAPAARNTGVRSARGELVAFQDSDDEWLPGKLELQVEAMRAVSADTALVFCGMVRYCPGQPLFRYPSRRLIPGGTDYHRLVKMNAIAFTQTWLARRQALVEAGPFDERLKIWDDWDMLLRLTSKHRVRCLPQPLVVSYITAGSVSSDVSARARDLLHVIAKYEHAEPRDRRFLGRLYYLLGRFQSLDGNSSEGRRSLLRAARHDPFSVKTFALLLTGFFRGQGFRRFLKRAQPGTK